MYNNGKTCINVLYVTYGFRCATYHYTQPLNAVLRTSLVKNLSAFVEEYT